VRLDSDGRWKDIGLLVLRVVVGIVFIMHGIMKAKMGLAGTIGFMTKIGVPLPQVAAPFSICAEIGGGIAQESARAAEVRSGGIHHFDHSTEATVGPATSL